jgi:hypothetical protein
MIFLEDHPVGVHDRWKERAKMCCDGGWSHRIDTPYSPDSLIFLSEGKGDMSKKIGAGKISPRAALNPFPGTPSEKAVARRVKLDKLWGYECPHFLARLAKPPATL